ncbi:ribonuclease T2 family protein [Pseudooceanicola nanhaiensis]|uniref:ribonuclease T2 family protein n=1 Tax=Pseudooceanicola nanhaiensis TaxID=375761 RepID=UPI001CD3A654|nr:ribonuclease T2 [Pseudooceanicola nanhaiensis]MCA0921318.1 ribonuclease T2 [Pseudooceanicola nanhaiensis]
MRQTLILLVFALCLAGATAPSARAEGARAGDFDYYLLSLSWSPTWCALEGAQRGSPQCDPGKGFGWVLHGLWPQNERGYPSYCNTTVRNPSKTQTAAMEDIMGAPGVAWYQWKKHGRCAGLEPEAYFDLARRAYASVTRPQVLRDLGRDVTLPAKVVEQAFLEANPQLEPDMITITCRSRRIQEARVCLTRDLEPRRCGADVIRDCSQSDALLEAVN